MLCRSRGRIHQIRLLHVETGVPKQREHSEDTLERRPELVAHVRQEIALGLIRRVRLNLSLPEVLRQHLQPMPPRLQLADLQHDQPRKHQRQRALKHRQQHPQPVLLAHGVVPILNLLGDLIRREHRKGSQRFFQSIDLILDPAPSTCIRLRVRLLPQERVHPVHETIQGLNRGHVLRGRRKDVLGPVRADDVDAADEDLVSGLD